MQEQTRYQVRFDWGAGGAAAIGGDADVLVRVSALPGGEALRDAVTGPKAVLDADLRTAAAAAAWIVRLQQELGLRVRIAVVAVGRAREDGALRPAVEDLLAAGAVIDALGAHGLDATSPEAAAAEAAYRSLGRAVGHLLTASVSATDAAVPPAIRRLDRALGADDAVVVTPHPGA